MSRKKFYKRPKARKNSFCTAFRSLNSQELFKVEPPSRSESQQKAASRRLFCSIPAQGLNKIQDRELKAAAGKNTAFAGSNPGQPW